MDNEYPNSGHLVIDRDAKINLTVNTPLDPGDMEIDLFQVFANMGKSAVFYLWLMVLFLTIGLSIPTVIYYLRKPPLTVSSAVTLNYMVQDELGNMKQVTDLTAPDGKPLDLAQITSSYVLQTALNSLDLSVPVSIENLRGNITIDRIATEESNQQMELVSKMIEDKNSALYEQVKNLEFIYSNRFVVTLKNGFGQANSKKKLYLKDDELPLVLNSILSAYNNYLVRTYADAKLPDNSFDLIKAGGIDNLQLMNMLNTSLDQLYAYCEQKNSDIRSYRSFKTGQSLNDLMDTIQLVQYYSTDYTEAMIQSEGRVASMPNTIAYYQFRKQDTQQKIDALNEAITSLNETIANYRNDEIILSAQGDEGTRTARMNTDAYNDLFTVQTDNFTTLEDLQYNNQLAQARLADLDGRESSEVTEAHTAEIGSAIDSAQRIFNEVNAHMQELIQSASFTTFLEYSAAISKPVSFLSANAKPLLIGGGVSIALALMFWFFHALRQDVEAGKRRFEEMEASRR